MKRDSGAGGGSGKGGRGEDFTAAYGAQAADTALDGKWRDRAELGEVYLAAVTHAYGGAEAVQPSEGFRNRVSEADVLVHPQDDRERDQSHAPRARAMTR